MKKILFISDFIFEKKVGAHNLAMAHLESIKNIFGEKNIEIIALVGKKVADSDSIIIFNSYSSSLGKLINLLQLNNPYINNNIIKKIVKIIESKEYDYIFIDNSTYGNLIKHIKKLDKNIKVISFYHDIKRNLAKKWLKEYGFKYLPEYITTIYNEYLNSKYADYHITLNKRESNMLYKHYQIKSDLELPIYMEDMYKNYTVSLEHEKIKVLFVGAFYYPNVKGIKWFIQNVLSKLDNRFELIIVGRGMEKIKDELLYDKVKVIGSVDDLSYYYNNCDIVIAPIFDGAGMKVKTAEAFMYGKVFIGTSEALEGYEYNKCPNIYKCDKAEEFVTILNKLKNESYINKSYMDENIRNLFLNNYSQESVIKKLKKFFENINI